MAHEYQYDDLYTPEQNERFRRAYERGRLIAKSEQRQEDAMMLLNGTFFLSIGILIGILIGVFIQ